MFHELLSRDCKDAVAAGDSCNMRVKFKFKFVLIKVNYCTFCLFCLSKMMFNFKFKLILRLKKIYVNSFFLNFRGPRYRRTTRGHGETARRGLEVRSQTAGDSRQRWRSSQESEFRRQRRKDCPSLLAPGFSSRGPVTVPAILSSR